MVADILNFHEIFPKRDTLKEKLAGLVGETELGGHRVGDTFHIHGGVL